MPEITINISQPQLQKWVIEKIHQNRKLKLALAYTIDKSENTVNKYLRENHVLLSKDYCLAVICEYLETSPDMVTEKRES